MTLKGKHTFLRHFAKEAHLNYLEKKINEIVDFYTYAPLEQEAAH